MPSELLISKNARFKTWTSIDFDIDNGAGTTRDDAFYSLQARRLLRARIVYVDNTSGTVAAGHIRVGTALNGVEVCAQTAYENSKAVGAQTALALVVTYVAPGGTIYVRHTGIAATAAGFARVEIDYALFDD